MEEANAHLVGELFEAWNRRDLSVQKAFAPDIEVEISHGMDIDGTYRGQDASFRAVMRFWGAFTDYRSEIEEMLPGPGDRIFITAHHYARGKQSGVAVDMTNWQVFTVRGGQVARYGIYGTRQQALEAAGLSE
jgi:ketosteroid isomerase-like protein